VRSRIEISVGCASQISSEFYQPLEPSGRHFVAPEVQAGIESLNGFVHDERIAIFEVPRSSACATSTRRA
jgi:hypothetical protein